MRIELQTARGEAVRDLEIPAMAPIPSVATLGARTFEFYAFSGRATIYREAFAVSLDGFLPGGGVTDDRAERA